VPDGLLRGALEAALGVARAGEESTPVEPAPAPLRPFIHFARLPARAMAAARRAVDGDDGFRARVAAVVAEDDVGRAGWLFLRRAEGWEDELRSMAAGAEESEAAQGERRAEAEARRRLAAVEERLARAEGAASAAKVEAGRAAAALVDERRARQLAVADADRARSRIAELEDERERLTGEVAAATEAAARVQRALDEARAEAGPPAPAAATEPAPAPDVDARWTALRAATVAAADAARRLADDLDAAVGAGETPGGAHLPPASRPAPDARRTPLPLPPAVFEDSPEAARHLLRARGVVLLVDGYNASLLGWPGLAIADQRGRLVDALAELAARTGAEVHVVFDGSEEAGSARVPSAPQRVRVTFTPGTVEADDVLIARAADVAATRPVVVASNDRRVQDGARRAGANVISSVQLLTVLHG